MQEATVYFFSNFIVYSYKSSFLRPCCGYDKEEQDGGQDNFHKKSFNNRPGICRDGPGLMINGNVYDGGL